MKPIYLTLSVVALLSGCQTSLPFPHQVVPVIPDSLKIKGAHAKAYAVNDAGHVVGVYSPPAPRKSEKIFVLADGRLIMHEYPCGGYLYAKIITSTGLIAGHCQPTNRGENHSFVFSYKDGSTLQAIQPAWPTTGYFVSGLTDRGDALGWTSDAYHRREPDGVLGFIYASGQLQLIRTSNSPAMKRFSNAVITASGLVIGGERDRLPSGKDEYKEFQYFMFQDDRFVELPSETSGWVKAANNQGHFVMERRGRSFGIKQAQFREIDCGKEWCSVDDINDRGWVVGDRHNTVPVPPFGASIGDTFLWADETFYSLDKSVGLKVNPEHPLKLSNKGHVVFHSDGWPYLLIPGEVSRAGGPQR